MDERKDLGEPTDNLLNATTPTDGQSSATGPQPIAPHEPMATPLEIHQRQAGQGGRRKLLLLTAVGLLVVAVFGATILLLRGSNKTDQPQTTAVVKKDIPVLQFGVQSDDLNIQLPVDTADEDTLQLLHQTHEGLVAWKNQTSIVPALAKSWSSPNATTWEFTLATGRMFHTGKPVTPEAVKASIDAVKDIDAELPAVQTISSVETEGSDKVKITTKSPDAALLNRLAALPIYDPTYPKGQSWNSGSGAFKLKEGQEVTSDSLKLVADDTYPTGRSHVREVDVVNILNNDDAVKALDSGTVDITTVGPSDQATAKKYTAYAFRTLKSTGSFTLRLNVTKTGAVFGNKTLRQAIATVMDTQKVVAADTDQSGEPANQLVSEALPGYNPAIKPIGPDTTKAKELIKQSGYANQVIKIGYYAGKQDKAMLEVARQLKEIGLNIQTGSKDNGKDFITAITDGEYDIVASTSLSTINDLSDVAADIAGKAAYIPVYYNPEVDKLLDDANSTFDPAKRLAKLQNISKTIIDDYGVIPLRLSLYPYYVKKSIVVGEADLPTTVNPVYLSNVYGQ